MDSLICGACSAIPPSCVCVVLEVFRRNRDHRLGVRMITAAAAAEDRGGAPQLVQFMTSCTGCQRGENPTWGLTNQGRRTEERSRFGQLLLSLLDCFQHKISIMIRFLFMSSRRWKWESCIVTRLALSARTWYAFCGWVASYRVRHQVFSEIVLCWMCDRIFSDNEIV